MKFLDFLSGIDMVDVVMNILLGIAALALIVSLRRAQKSNGGSKYANFNLIDLVTSRDGFVDRPALQETVAFAVMTWAFVALTIKGLLSEWYVVAYGGMWVIRAAHSAYMKVHEPEIPAVVSKETSSITKTETKTEIRTP